VVTGAVLASELEIVEENKQNAMVQEERQGSVVKLSLKRERLMR